MGGAEGMTPDSQSFYQLMLSVGMLVTIAAGVAVIFNGRKVQRREITMVQEYATKDEMKAATDRIVKLENSIETLRREMREDSAEILKAGEERAEKLHRRINRVLIGVSKLQGRFNIPAEETGEEDPT
jgi:predicted nucleotide-binding protein (sugar kinase/HSP70/actin superfamily)